MTVKPSYEELDHRIKELEAASEADGRRLTEKLRESQEQLSVLSGQTLLAVVILQDNRVVYANEAYTQMTGYPLSEILTWSIEDTVKLIHPEYREFVIEQGLKKMKAEKDGIVNKYQYKGIKKNGEEGWIDQFSQTILYKGKPADMISMIEITHHKEAEAALRESEERFRNLAELLPETIFEMDATGILTFANQSAFTQFGYTQADFNKGLNGLDLIVPEDRERGMRNIMEIMGGKNLGLKEYQALHKDGTTFPGLFRSTAIVRKGEPIGLRGFIIDISEQKQMEEAVKESAAKYRQLVQHAPAGIYELDLKEMRFTSVNDVMCEYTGYTEAEFMALPPFEVIVEGREEALKGFMDRLAAGVETPPPVEFKIRGKNGKEFWVLINSRYFYEDGVPVKVMAVAHNITELNLARKEKKKLEARLHQSQKMESLGTLAGGIAHDFNNLLMGIQGNVSLMRTDTGVLRDFDANFTNIEQYVQRGEGLTRQLLGLVRGGKYEVKAIDINELFQESSDMFGRTRKEIRIHRRFQEAIWTIEVDRGQIDQVLLNTFVNAWQAMPDGGDLYLETQNIILDEDYVKPYSVKAGRYVKISITDNGAGMDNATLQQVFDPFFTTKEMGRGTGLGLASAYGIIRNHHGIITVYSEVGQGATFNIYLPASEKEAVRQGSVPGTAVKGSGSILLVDDEKMILEVGQAMLERLGYHVVVADNGASAIEKYHNGKQAFDLIILDMIMPDMGGGEVMDQLKATHPGVKILLSSGYSINGQVTEILNRGCSGFIQKPFGLDELSHKIREILETDKT